MYIFLGKKEMLSEEDVFQEVHLWDMTNLYVILNHDIWLNISDFLKRCTLSKLSGHLEIYYKVLCNIRDNPSLSISVPNLLKLCQTSELDLEIVEKSIQSVRFTSHGKQENILFPFKPNIYAWRAICHILGDGTIDRRNSYPTLVWTQEPKNQGFMRDLLEKLSRRPGGKSERVNFPKGLTSVIMAAIPNLTFFDLKTLKFIHFIINLPPKYRDWKVQFLTAFILDDGTVRNHLRLAQKNKAILENIMCLCDQLGYEHSPYPPKLHGRAYGFSLYQQGVVKFYKDLNKISSNDPLLGLWHKSNDLIMLVTSYDLDLGFARQKAKEVCTIVIKILGDHQIRDTTELRSHLRLRPLLKNKYSDYLIHRLRFLQKKGFIHQVKKKQEQKKPYLWVIPSLNDPAMLIDEFNNSYGHTDRIRKQ
jgi:hypothetical protein